MAFLPQAMASSLHTSTQVRERPFQVTDELVMVRRKEKQLEEHLQELLDAQAEGLTAGFGGGIPDDQASNGSNTPTPQNIQWGQDDQVRVVPRQRPSLSVARKGIYTTIQELADLKTDEAYLLETDLSESQKVIARINGWETKREKLEKKIDAIERTGAGPQIEQMQTEADELENEIQELETKLSGMKAKHRQLLKALANAENSVQANLSTYKTSLSLLEEQIHGFLATPSSRSVPSSRTATSFLDLPVKRRTLGMSKEYWQREQHKLEEEHRRADSEREALEQGTIIWNNVVNDISGFEQQLRKEMYNLGVSSKDHSAPDPAAALSSLLTRMDELIKNISISLELAERKGWKLLVCCIGAELEALKEGQTILENTVKATEISHNAPSANLINIVSSSSPQKQESFGTGQPREIVASHLPAEQSDTDDDPDPELLISHQDTDTD